MGTKLKSTSPQQMLARDITGIHLEPTNICTLKCSGCARTRFIEKWPQHWKNHSVDIEQLNKFLDIDLQHKTITLCGNYGDPIYHTQFHELISSLKSQGAKLHIITNGSYRTADWWTKTVSILDSVDQIVFSVDGLPENFTQYRKNADWDSIHLAMEICAESTCKTEWKFIPFSFNENDIESTRELSEKLGIDIFKVEPSDRFDEQTNYLKPQGSYIGSRYINQQSWKQNNQQVVDPQCADNQQHYISADGVYSPCCYIADHRFYYKTEFGKNKKSYNIADHTLSQILTRPAVVEFYSNLTNKPVCQYNCPAT
jgi:MoaA/NifB/PqqE/SkfB family radical SAM enzyme